MADPFVYIVGVNGNMGQRYATILRHLGVAYTGSDKETPPEAASLARAASHIIICTPTKQHLEDIKAYAVHGVPILCEKPLTTNIDDLWKFERENKRILHLISMVNQYDQLAKAASKGLTVYDYFKSGGDSIFWDCINIVGLAKDEIKLSNESPIWKCVINGHKLCLSDIDRSYVDMMIDWLKYPVSNFEYAKIAHAKVMNLILEDIET